MPGFHFDLICPPSSPSLSLNRRDKPTSPLLEAQVGKSVPTARWHSNSLSSSFGWQITTLPIAPSLLFCLSTDLLLSLHRSVFCWRRRRTSGGRPSLRWKLINQSPRMMAKAGAGGESKRKDNNHNGERRGEIGGQMNWTISLRAWAEGQALCKTESMWAWRAIDGEGGWTKSGFNREKMRNPSVRKR